MRQHPSTTSMCAVDRCLLSTNNQIITIFGYLFIGRTECMNISHTSLYYEQEYSYQCGVV